MSSASFHIVTHPSASSYRPRLPLHPSSPYHHLLSIPFRRHSHTIQATGAVASLSRAHRPVPRRMSSRVPNPGRTMTAHHLRLCLLPASANASTRDLAGPCGHVSPICAATDLACPRCRESARIRPAASSSSPGSNSRKQMMRSLANMSRERTGGEPPASFTHRWNRRTVEVRKKGENKKE